MSLLAPPPEQHSAARLAVLALAAQVLFALASARAGELEYRRFEQNPALDNLAHPAGYQTGPEVSLGRVEKVGHGPRAMVLLAGGQFGGEVFARFMEANRGQFTMYAVTLAGFGGTPAPPMPPPDTSYGQQTWIRAAERAVERWIVKEKLDQPVVVGHWIIGGDVALRLALDHPERVGSLVVLSGVPRWPLPGNQAMTLEERIAFVDRGLAPQWFRTVTEETWEDNNFLPRDYARHPVLGLQLWRQAEAVPLPVKIRYTLEARAQDLAAEAARLTVPTLVVLPGFDDAFFAGPHDSSYMRWFCHDGWEGVATSNERIVLATIPGARVFVMDDAPDKLRVLLDDFLTDPTGG